MPDEKNTNIPEKHDGGLSDDKRYFKAVSNYMANVLGIDRNEIYKMLAEKIEARNVDQAVLEAVTRYFGFGPDGFGHGSHVEDRLNRSVDQYVKEMFQKGAGAWMDRLIQERLEQMAGNDHVAARDRARDPDTKTASRPGLYVYSTSVWLDLPTFNAMISEWIEKSLPARPHAFTTQLRTKDKFWPHELTVNVKSLDKDELKVVDDVNESTTPSWPGWRDVNITDKAVKKILAQALGWPEVSRIVAGTDGVAVFPPETLCHDK